MFNQKIALDFDILTAVCQIGDFKGHFKTNNSFFIKATANQVQEITYSKNPWDAKLLEASVYFFGLLKRECMYIKLHCNMGECLYSKIFHGGRSHVSSFKQIRQIIQKLSLDAKSSGLEILKVEIVHTHMKDEFLDLDSRGYATKITSWPLSQSDLLILDRLKSFIKAPILMRAVTNKKISYEILK